MNEESPAFQRAMERGHTAAWEMSWDQAAVCYRKALTENPDHPQALVSLGLALYEQGSLEQALICYIKAARIFSDDPMPMEKISQIYQRLDNLDRAFQAAMHSAELYIRFGDGHKATENWERAIALRPDDQGAYARLAAALERNGDHEGAVREYLALASLQQDAGEGQKAFETVEQALHLSPTSQMAIKYKGLLKASKPLPKPEVGQVSSTGSNSTYNGQFEASPEQFHPDSGLDPVESSYHQSLAQLASQLFDANEVEAKDTGERLPLNALVTGTGRTRKPTDQTRKLLHLSQSIDLQSRKEYGQAANELQRAMNGGPVHPATAFNLAYLMVHGGMPEEAIPSLQIAANHLDYALGARLVLGEIYRQKDLMMQAAVESLEALKIADVLTVSPSRKENLIELYEPLLEAYRLQPDATSQPRLVDDIHHLLMRPDWKDQIQRIRLQFSNASVNRPLAEMFTEVGGNQLVLAFSRVRELKDQRRSLSAMEEAYYALEIAPTYLPLHILMAELLVDTGEIEQAVEKYLVIARVYSMRGEAVQASMLYRTVLRLEPADLSVRKRLINELIVSGQYEQAFTETMQLAEVFISLADLAMARSSYMDALQISRSYHLDQGNELGILRRIADIDLQSLDWKQAVMIYEQIRSLQPENCEIRHQLINLYLRLGHQQAASREILDYLKLLEEKHLTEMSIPFLDEVRRDHPENSSLQKLLTDIYRQLGNT